MWGLGFGDDGKENRDYYLVYWGVYRDNGKEAGNYYSIMGL